MITMSINENWVDSISKILKSKKAKGKKSIVLSKAKKLTDVSKQKSEPAGFEVATEDGDVKEVKIEQDEVQSSEPQHKKRKELPNFRVKPNVLEKDRERTLNKIATRGVVQLFNSVRIQQKELMKYE